MGVFLWVILWCHIRKLRCRVQPGELWPYSHTILDKPIWWIYWLHQIEQPGYPGASSIMEKGSGRGSTALSGFTCRAGEELGLREFSINWRGSPLLNHHKVMFSLRKFPKLRNSAAFSQLTIPGRIGSKSGIPGVGIDDGWTKKWSWINPPVSGKRFTGGLLGFPHFSHGCIHGCFHKNLAWNRPGLPPLLGLPFGRPHTQHLGQMAAKKQLPTASRLLGDCSCSDCLTHHTLLNEIAFFENTSIVFMPRATLALNSFYEAGLNMLDGSRDSHLKSSAHHSESQWHNQSASLPYLGKSESLPGFGPISNKFLLKRAAS